MFRSFKFASYTLMAVALLLAPAQADARADHLLISELCINPAVRSDDDSAQYIELYNPTSSPIDLTNYYVTDYPAYFMLPAGSFNFGDRSEFLLRFPAGTVINGNHTLVIAQNTVTFVAQHATKYGGTLEAFAAQPGHPTLFEVKNSSATTPDMINFKQNQPRPHTLSMNSAGGFVAVFYWDGQSDLVKDVDIVRWGTAPAAEALQFKTGISVDGPDADSIASTYAADNGLNAKSPTGNAQSLKRVTANETDETTVDAGNGITGHDETKENVQNTFAGVPISALSPGTPNVSVFPASVNDWQVY